MPDRQQRRGARAPRRGNVQHRPRIRTGCMPCPPSCKNGTTGLEPGETRICDSVKLPGAEDEREMGSTSLQTGPARTPSRESSPTQLFPRRNDPRSDLVQMGSTLAMEIPPTDDRQRRWKRTRSAQPVRSIPRRLLASNPRSSRTVQHRVKRASPHRPSHRSDDR